MPLLSDRAGKTSEVVVLSASTEDPGKAPPGLLRFGLWLICASISAFFTALVIAYYWRKGSPGIWDQIALPGTLWISTAIILASSGVFEAARRTYGRGRHAAAARLLLVTGCLGLAFLAAQMSAWRTLVARGAYLEQNPYSGFFYLFTGLHAAHLVGGLVALGFVVLARAPRRELVDCAAFYWHFLGVLWIALFVVLSH
ncbi:MAG: cytochrome c oxidase subunit 3 [Acidobacteriota bacterium]